MSYEVRPHSGRSVFKWRVYHVVEALGRPTIRIQLAKRRTQEAAERTAKFYREFYPDTDADIVPVEC